VTQAFLPAQGRQECLPHNDACANRLDSKSGFLKESSESGKGSPKAGSENRKYTGYTDFFTKRQMQRCIRVHAWFINHSAHNYLAIFARFCGYT